MRGRSSPLASSQHEGCVHCVWETHELGGPEHIDAVDELLQAAPARASSLSLARPLAERRPATVTSGRLRTAPSTGEVTSQHRSRRGAHLTPWRRSRERSWPAESGLPEAPVCSTLVLRIQRLSRS